MNHVLTGSKKTTDYFPILPDRFGLSLPDPKSSVIDRYTTGVYPIVDFLNIYAYAAVQPTALIETVYALFIGFLDHSSRGSEPIKS